MEKSAALANAARGIAAAGSGLGLGVLAEKQIQKNKYNSRTRKGWDTRRKNMQKKAAESSSDLVSKARSLGNSIIYNPPGAGFKGAAAGYLTRRALASSKKAMNPPKQPPKPKLPEGV